MAVIEQHIEYIKKIKNGFRHIIEVGNQILTEYYHSHFELSNEFLNDDAYQVRMLAVYLLGQLSTDNPKALNILETKAGNDNNWRVQEMLAKAFDHYCKTKGYEKSLPIIKKWLSNKNPNIKRAVIEGLRPWTNRPYFKENPQMAINLISEYRDSESEYLRKSVGNALRDVRKKNKKLVEKETSNWENDAKIELVKRLIEK